MTKYIHIGILTTAVITIIAFITITAFSRTESKPPNGTIEGYVFPSAAKPFVEISIPTINGDTITKKANPNANGYFKFNNIPTGAYVLEYWPKNSHYLSKSKNVTVVASQTVNAGTVTLQQ